MIVNCNLLVSIHGDRGIYNTYQSAWWNMEYVFSDSAREFDVFTYLENIYIVNYCDFECLYYKGTSWQLLLPDII